MSDVGDLSFLTDALPSGPLPIPEPPDGALDPWTGQPLASTTSGDIPQLAAPVVTTIELPAAPAPDAEGPPAASDESSALPVVTLPDVSATPTSTGTPITREEVLELLEELNATIYLMV